MTWKAVLTVVMVALISFSFASPSIGIGKSFSDIAQPLVQALLPNERGQGSSIDCDQEGTTTPCASSPFFISNDRQQRQSPLSKKSFGFLVHTYTNEPYGFSLKYPDELSIENGGDIALTDNVSGKKFSLKICSPQSLCGSTFATVPSSPADFKKPQNHSYKGVSGSLTYQDVPTRTSQSQLPNGRAIFNQEFVMKIFDETGADVTAQECEMCGSPQTRYIVFNDSGEYFILVPGRFNDPALERAIIQSISY